MLVYTDQVLLIEALAKQLGALLVTTGMKVATAESCTGGWVAQAITQVPGSSRWFDRGFVVYSDEAKREMLSVKVRSLNKYGAVSEKVVCEMAAGAVKKSHARFSVAITGLAGPDGGSEDTPLGSVWLAWCIDGEVDCSKLQLPGERRDIRAACVTLALQGLLVRIRNWLNENPLEEKDLLPVLDETE